MRIDTAFDFRSDTPSEADPDSASPTLRRFHKVLWSKALPCGAGFELVDTTPGIYLHHRSPLGEFRLSSDTVIPTFRKEKSIAHIVSADSEGLAEFMRIGYTIGAMMLFPGNQVDRRMTINAARGCHPRIKDRFDLTVECIRRHYVGEESPLSATLARYDDFFRLFRDFHGYVEYFLLQDLVTDDFAAVKFHLAFDGFESWPVPKTTEEYAAYRGRAIGFIEARNRRIGTIGP